MFTITVTDVNESPIQMNFIASLASKFVIAENVPMKTVLGTIETYDPDNVDRATLEMTTLSSPVFKLDTAGATCAVVSLSGNFLITKQIQYVMLHDKNIMPTSCIFLFKI